MQPSLAQARELRRSVAPGMPDVNDLFTDREREVAGLLAQGKKQSGDCDHTRDHRKHRGNAMYINEVE